MAHPEHRPQQSPTLEVRALTKSFPGVLALDSVSLEVQPGEIHGLVGKNGAGKSTLVNILAGLIAPSRGSMLINGTPLPHLDPVEANRNGIFIVRQTPEFVDQLTIAENMLLGRLPTSTGGTLDWPAVIRSGRRALAQMSIDVDVRALAEEMSVVERQMVAIAMALSREAQLIILDEPTATLAAEETRELFQKVRQLRSSAGITFIYISHYLEEIFELCDNVTVLRDGRKVATRAVAELSEWQLTQLMAGSAGVEVAAPRDRAAKPRKPLVEIRDLASPGRFANVDITLYEGEIVALGGLAGSGKSEVLQVLFGMAPLDHGNVTFRGRPLAIRSPRVALEQGVCYVPADRRQYGVVPAQPVWQNIWLSWMDAVVDGLGFLKTHEARRRAGKLATRLDVKTPSLETPVEELSGGNQQKVLLARALGTQPSLLLLDNPLQGIDVTTKAELQRIIEELAREGVTILLASDEISELRMASRIYILFGGFIVGEFPSDAPEEELLAAIEGVATTGGGERTT
jgi:ABC-type sugar transport system ATPase subunit